MHRWTIQHNFLNFFEDTKIINLILDKDCKMWILHACMFTAVMEKEGGSPATNHRLKSYKNKGMDSDELRRRREEEGIQLRKQKREQQVRKTQKKLTIPGKCVIFFGFVSFGRPFFHLKFGSVHSSNPSIHKINTRISLWNTSFRKLWKCDWSLRSLYFVVIQEKKCISRGRGRWWRYFTTPGILSFLFISVRSKFRPSLFYFISCTFTVPTWPGKTLKMTPHLE